MSHDESQLLRIALRANGAFTALSAVCFLTASGSISAFLGILSAGQVLFQAAQLGLFAVWLFWLAARPVIPRWQIVTIILLDVVWVVGSFIILVNASPELTVAGKWSIGVVALIVTLFAALQAAGFMRYRRATQSLQEGS